MRKQTGESAAHQVAPAPEPHADLLSVEVPREIPLMAYAMVRTSRVAAILVGPFGPPRQDAVLWYIKAAHQGWVCWVDIDEIDLAHSATRSWIDAQHERLRRPAGASILPGYYLFLDGQVWAYHSGSIDFKRDKVWLGFGIAAALAALHWQSNSLLDQAFHVASSQASARVLQSFEAAIAYGQQHGTHHVPPPPPVQEATVDAVGLAFEVLGLAPSATQDEVKAQFRALAKEWHPDRFANNASKVTEANARMRQINDAHDVICKARGW
jgi:hypothetical protein